MPKKLDLRNGQCDVLAFRIGSRRRRDCNSVCPSRSPANWRLRCAMAASRYEQKQGKDRTQHGNSQNLATPAVTTDSQERNSRNGEPKRIEAPLEKTRCWRDRP